MESEKVVVIRLARLLGNIREIIDANIVSLTRDDSTQQVNEAVASLECIEQDLIQFAEVWLTESQKGKS